MTRKYLAVSIAAVVLGGCVTAAEHQASLPSAQEKKLTVGIVQKEIRQGMSQVAVAEVLGSPNIVSRDSDEKEAWIYDKISSETAYSKSSGGVQALVLGWGGSVAAGAAPGYSASSGAASRTQRTLTIVIKFKKGVVDEFSYHATSF